MTNVLFFLSLLIVSNECGVILISRVKPKIFYIFRQPRPDFNPLFNDTKISFGSTSTTLPSTSSESVDEVLTSSVGTTAEDGEEETTLTLSTTFSQTISTNKEVTNIVSTASENYDEHETTSTTITTTTDDEKTTITLGTTSDQDNAGETAGKQTDITRGSTISENYYENEGTKLTVVGSTTVKNDEKETATTVGTTSLLTTTKRVGSSDSFDSSGSGDDEDTDGDEMVTSTSTQSDITGTIPVSTTSEIIDESGSGTSDSFDGSGSGDDEEIDEVVTSTSKQNYITGTTRDGTTSDTFDGSGSGDDEDSEKANTKNSTNIPATIVSTTSTDGSGSGNDVEGSASDNDITDTSSIRNKKENESDKNEEKYKSKVAKSILDDDFVFVDEDEDNSREISESNEVGSGTGEYLVTKTKQELEKNSTTGIQNTLFGGDKTNTNFENNKNDTKKQESFSESENNKIPFEVIPPEILEINRDNIDEDYFLIIDGFANPRNSVNITDKITPQNPKL